MDVNLLDVLEAAENAGALKPVENDDVNFYDSAILGINDSGRLVYSKERMCDLLTRLDDMDYNEAWEFLEYSCFNAYLGVHTPIYVNQYN
jgi:hypothetical protein